MKTKKPRGRPFLSGVANPRFSGDRQSQDQSPASPANLDDRQAKNSLASLIDDDPALQPVTEE